jgi:adenylate cyclase
MTSDVFPWRPLGSLLVDKGFLTVSELDEALAEQRRTRRLLGQILVARSFLSSFSLSQTLAEQHGVGVQARGAAPASNTAERRTAWRPLGRVLVDTWAC